MKLPKIPLWKCLLNNPSGAALIFQKAREILLNQVLLFATLALYNFMLQ